MDSTGGSGPIPEQDDSDAVADAAIAHAVAAKLRRLADPDQRPTVLDVFSGCGGISLGFLMAGFEPIACLDSEPLAAATYTRNLLAGMKPALRKAVGQGRDIRAIDPSDFLRECGFSQPLRAVDVLVGGPPCQAYARVGRAKLREVALLRELPAQDERVSLYEHYLRFVRELCPLAILMENVPDILSFQGRNIAEEIAVELGRLGYEARYTLVNAAAMGVPQTRERMYLVAIHRSVGRLPRFPAATYDTSNLPSGYRSSRAMVIPGESKRRARPSVLPEHYVRFDTRAAGALPSPISAEEALYDLPMLTAHLTGDDRRGARRFDIHIPYRHRAEPGSFAARMRHGPMFPGSPAGPADQVTRSLPRDYAIFARMNPGDQYPEAHSIAEELFAAACARHARNGDPVAEGSAAWTGLRAQCVPPYDPSKFPNKWRKLEHDRPSRTLMAHMAHDTYSHIHYDSDQARTITVREAARLQSFPDGFVFEGAMNQAFRMIGNAVPPLVAEAIARVLLQDLRLGACR
jgi:DNA (cytosine-5)-methyltransferase 1